MKRLSFWFTALAAVVSLGFMSCGDTETNPTVNGPSVEFLASTPASQTVEPGTAITVKAVIAKGDANLKEMKFTVSGNALDTDRVSVANETVETGSIVNLSNSGGTYTITFTTSSSDGTEEIVLEVTDKDGQTTSKTITIITETPSTKTVQAYTAVLISAPTGDGANTAFYASSSNSTYNYANATSNSALIDFGYFHSGSSAQITAPSTYTAASNSAANWTTKNATKIISVTASDYTNATVTTLEALDFSSAATTIENLAVDSYFAFQTVAGETGIVKVTAITGTFNANDGITLDIKVTKEAAQLVAAKG